MNDSIGRMAAVITTDLGGFTGGLARGRRELGQFVRDTSAMGSGISLGGLAGLARGIAPQLAALASVGGAVAGLKSAADEAERMLRVSNDLGMSFRNIGRLSATAQLSGTSFEAVAAGITKMQKAIGEAYEGSSQAQTAFANIGLAVEDLIGLSPDEQFRKVAMAVMEIPNPALRAAAAADLFGKSWSEISDVLRAAKDGMKDMDKFAMTEQAATALAEAGDRIDAAWMFAKTSFKGGVGLMLSEVFGLGEGAKSAEEMAEAARKEARYRREAAEAAIAQKKALEEQKQHEQEMRRWRESGKKLRETAASLDQMTLDLLAPRSEAARMRDRMIEEMREAGWTEESIKIERDAMDAQVAMYEAAKQRVDAEREAQAALKGTRTEAEQYADAIRQANQWLALGAITQTQHARLAGRARKELADSLKGDRSTELAPLARRGSEEEYRVVADAINRIQQQDATQSRLDQVIANTERAARAAERLNSTFQPRVAQIGP